MFWDLGFIKGLYWEPQTGNPKNIIGGSHSYPFSLGFRVLRQQRDLYSSETTHLGMCSEGWGVIMSLTPPSLDSIVVTYLFSKD